LNFSAIHKLKELLSEGAKPQLEIKALFLGLGIGWRTVESDKGEMGIVQASPHRGVENRALA
jgi:hypothetical protein